MDFNLEYYKAFYYASKTGSYSRAAEALFLTQPAVSQSIRRLEDSFGAKLFTRGSRGMTLTPEGRLLYAHVEKAFTLLDAGEQRLLRFSSLEDGELHIGATETALSWFILPKLSVFRAQYPGVRLLIRGMHSTELTDMLRNGDIDVAFGVSPVPNLPELSVTAIEDFQDIFVAGAGFGALSDRIVTMEELASLPLVTASDGSIFRNLSDWFASLCLTLSPQFSVVTTSFILPFLENDLAAACIPEYFYESWKRVIPSLFRIKTETLPPRRSVFFATNRSIPAPRACHALIRLLFPEAAERHVFGDELRIHD